MTSDNCDVSAEQQPIAGWSSSDSSISRQVESRQPLSIDNTEFQSSYSAPRPTPNTNPPKMRPSSSLRTSRARARRMDIESGQDQQNIMLRDIERTRYDIGKVREDMDKLTKKLQSMATDITSTKTRVSNMEQTLVSTQEVNVNLQILLERAVLSQKKVDTDTMQRVRQFQGDLSKILDDNEEMQTRVSSMESNQYTYDGRVADLNNQVREYANLLEQARDTIHSMADITSPSVASSEEYPDAASSRRASIASSWATEDEGVSKKESEITSITSPKLSYTTVENKDMLRSRIIRTNAISSDKETATGLKLLLSDKSFQRRS
ncbi:hypothetical protein BC943DRAFT_325222 [Umbelopsis sp. AD052]|nr:hypothetical protein BC943DRAFT_325222 [Umbelopsis sp. AD052]